VSELERKNEAYLAFTLFFTAMTVITVAHWLLSTKAAWIVTVLANAALWGSSHGLRGAAICMFVLAVFGFVFL